MDKEELLVCPFCGETKELLLWNGDDVDNIEQTQVVCNNLKGGCGGAAGWQSTEQEAIKAWNTRISND